MQTMVVNLMSPLNCFNPRYRWFSKLPFFVISRRYRPLYLPDKYCTKWYDGKLEKWVPLFTFWAPFQKKIISVEVIRVYRSNVTDLWFDLFILLFPLAYWMYRDVKAHHKSPLNDLLASLILLICNQEVKWYKIEIC